MVAKYSYRILTAFVELFSAENRVAPLAPQLVLGTQPPEFTSAFGISESRGFHGVFLRDSGYFESTIWLKNTFIGVSKRS